MRSRTGVRLPRPALAVATLLIGSSIGLYPAFALPPGAVTQTTTTTYTYNGDGALTSFTTQVDAGPPTTTYVTWDNFTPSASDPATGTVSAADGNLAGYGPSPAPAALEALFSFDARDRLIGYSNSSGQSVSYAYHPTSLMASSTRASGDSLQFYYDTSSQSQVTNVVQSSTGLTSSYLAGRQARYLDDGSEQLLISPRKDVSGIYDAAAGSFTSYQFDPYGAPLSESGGGGGFSSGSEYDMAQNPFQYAQELRDPLWGGYYLRARWYSPALQVFLSRDPRRNLNRYGYTDGNPVMRVDPSGMGYQHSGFSRGLNHFLNQDLGGQGHGAWGELWGGLSRMTLAVVIGPLQLIATPYKFWRTATHSARQAPFLWAGVVSEVVTAPFPEMSFGPHVVFDLAFGVGQSTLSALSHNLRSFNVRTFVHGLELTAGGIFDGRFLAGIGYRPYDLSEEDVDKYVTQHFAESTDPLVFRMRMLQSDAGWWAQRFSNTSPLLEAANWGTYHEVLLAVNQFDFMSTENINYLRTFNSSRTWGIGTFVDERFTPAARPTFSFAGRVDLSAYPNGLRDFDQAFEANPRSLPSRSEYSDYKNFGVPYPANKEPYSLLFNNCHQHSAAIRESLEFR